jgi:hypothetical protein
VPHWAAQIYFGVGGLVTCCVGIALLINFRGLGKQWDEGMNRNSAYANRLLHLPWLPNPYLGPTFRPVVGVFATVLGLAKVAAVLIGVIR